MALPKPEKEINGTPVWSVAELLKVPTTENEWIVKNLLRPGSQMLLAGPPKSGKSFIASQIALTLSLPFELGERRCLFDAKADDELKFPGLEVAPPKDKRSWDVLFISLEMGVPEVAGRLRRQLAHFDRKPPEAGASEDCLKDFQFPLTNVFGLVREASTDPNQDLQIVTIAPSKDGQQSEVQDGAHLKLLRDLITEAKPDVVVYDTLIQLHNVNENDNVIMKAVMRALRRATVIMPTPGGVTEPKSVAHIVVHHTRKESGNFRASLSPDIMRGAGAVHAAADLVMLARRERPETVEVHISSRSSAIPNFYLKQSERSLAFSWEPRLPTEKKKKLTGKEGNAAVEALIVKELQSLKEGNRRLSESEFPQLIGENGLNISKLQKRFDELCKRDEIHIQKVIKESSTKTGEIRDNAATRWFNCWFGLGAAPDSWRPIEIPSRPKSGPSERPATKPRNKEKKNPRTP